MQIQHLLPPIDKEDKTRATRNSVHRTLSKMLCRILSSTRSAIKNTWLNAIKHTVPQGKGLTACNQAHPSLQVKLRNAGSTPHTAPDSPDPKLQDQASCMMMHEPPNSHRKGALRVASPAQLRLTMQKSICRGKKDCKLCFQSRSGLLFRSTVAQYARPCSTS